MNLPFFSVRRVLVPVAAIAACVVALFSLGSGVNRAFALPTGGVDPTYTWTVPAGMKGDALSNNAMPGNYTLTLDPGGPAMITFRVRDSAGNTVAGPYEVAAGHTSNPFGIMTGQAVEVDNTSGTKDANGSIDAAGQP